MGHRVAPHPLVDLLPAEHPVRLREQVQDLELPRGQLEAALARVRLIEIRADRDLADDRRVLRSPASRCGGAGGSPPRSRRSAPRRDRAWSPTRRRRAAGRGRAARPTTVRCRRSPPGREAGRRHARGTPSYRVRARPRRRPARSGASPRARPAVTGLDSARSSQPSASRRFDRTCVKPGVAVDDRKPEPVMRARRGRL